MNLKYLITGTGRCGTVYMARLLTSIGIPCGHETIFDYRGTRGARKRLIGEEPLRLSFVASTNYDIQQNKFHPIDWLPDVSMIVAESSYMAAPFLRCDLLKDAKIIHVVRNPVDVVSSFCNHIDYFSNTPNPGNLVYETFIYRHIKKLKVKMPQYDRAALYYLRWNEMIENQKPDFFFRVEDDPKDLLKFLGVPDDVEYFKDKKANTLKKKDSLGFNWTQIESRQIRKEFIEVSKKYGYDLYDCLI